MPDRPSSGPSGLRPARRDIRPTASGTGTPKKVLPSSKWDGIEVVPDSEEERTRVDPDIIEISSDEDEEIPNPKAKPGDPALRVPGAWLDESRASPSGTPRKTPATKTPATPTPSKTKKVPSNRPQVAERTSADAVEDEVIIVANPEWLTPKSKPPPKHFSGKKSHTPRTSSPDKSARGTPRFVAASEGSDSEVEVLGTPMQIPSSKEKSQPLYEDESDDTSSSGSSEEPWAIDSNSSQPVYDVPNKYEKYWTPANGKASSSKSPSKPKPKILTLEDETRDREAHRVEYAQQVYSYLNKVVFKNRLPSLAKIGIIWNNKLLTTAGRAQFHRDRQGNEFAEIHLATKVIDTDERIRNTLSHEMCHLACWMIDKQIKEAHGKLFHKWADRVERKDPDIAISVQHTYVISYPFEWSCLDCEKIIQRYTNSVDMTKGCPACKTGKLKALFDLPPKKDVVRKTSKMAAAKSQNSPRPRPRPTAPICISSSEEDEDEDEDDDEEISSVHTQQEIYVVPDSDSEPEEAITDLARKFGGITIGHRVCLHARRATRA
ncbi:SprT-like family-domain-containing protein, partial [Mycena vulgaris]